MKPVSQLIVRFSILCYLLVASIAAAHAFPMPRAAGRNDALMVMDVALGDKQALTLDETASMSEMPSDCHQSKTASSDASSMSLCKIFCSVTGYAVTTDIFVDLASITRPLQTSGLSHDFSTRQISVEQHPPI